MYGCACGIKIPPAGSFGPLLGAGAINTDTGLGGVATTISSTARTIAGQGGTGSVAPNMLDWQRHPIAWLLVLVFVIILARRLLE